MIKPTSNSQLVLDYIKNHNNATVIDTADALTAKMTKVEVSTALFTLWAGRYITRVKGATRNAAGMPLFEYQYKQDQPRRKRHYTKRATNGTTHTEAPAAASNGLKIVVAVPDMEKGLVLTVAQARELFKQLKALEL